jgi:hypothetical protein
VGDAGEVGTAWATPDGAPENGELKTKAYNMKAEAIT